MGARRLREMVLLHHALAVVAMSLPRGKAEIFAYVLPCPRGTMMVCVCVCVSSCFCFVTVGLRGAMLIDSETIRM